MFTVKVRENGNLIFTEIFNDSFDAGQRAEELREEGYNEVYVDNIEE